MNNTVFYISIAVIIILVLAGVFLPKVFDGDSTPPLKRAAAVLSLSSEKTQYTIGDSVPVDVYLESEQSFDGVDVLIKYDPVYLGIETDPYPYKENFFLRPDQSIFEHFIEPRIDKDKGEIKFSALLGRGDSLQGRVKIGSLSFSAIQKGRTEIKLVFEKGNTIDSNVSSFDLHQDILAKVENISLLIND